MRLDVDDAVLLVHAAASAGMFGVIWFVQIVHYPLFARVGPGEFRLFEWDHQRRTTMVVGPLMLAQAASAAAVWVLGVGGQSASWWGPAACGLVAIAWGLTFLVSVPLHGKLERGQDERVVRQLALTNWPRTLVWTAHFMLSLWMVRADASGASA